MRTKVTSILLLCTLYPSQNKALRHITEIGPTKFRPQFECFIENQSINQGNINTYSIGLQHIYNIPWSSRVFAIHKCRLLVKRLLVLIKRRESNHVSI